MARARLRWCRATRRERVAPRPRTLARAGRPPPCRPVHRRQDGAPRSFRHYDPATGPRTLRPMSDPRDTESVERVIHAPADAIFALLADPSRHKEIDGSGSVREAKQTPQRVK